MAFTPEQEAEIIHALRRLSDAEKKHYLQSPKAFISFASGLLGSSAVNYVLNQHGWPAVGRKIDEIRRKIGL